MSTTQTRLAENCMLVSLNISMWSGHKFDKKVSQEVNELHHATEEAGRYNKRLLPKHALKEIRSIQGKARAIHNNLTRSWDDNGGRLLPSKLYFDYTKQMRDLENQFEKAVKAFSKKYPDYIKEHRASLGTLYSASDYPPPAHITERFGFSTTVMNFPSAEDFRVDLGEDEVKEIKKGIEKNINDKLADSAHEIWERAYKIVENMFKRLSDAEGTFHNTLVGNIEDMVSLLPALNVNNDPDLSKLGNELRKKLCQYQPDQLRTDKKARRETAKNAKAMLKDMEAYIGS